MYNFGQTSWDRLMTCTDTIVKVMSRAIKVTDIDFGIAFGGRTADEQFELFKKGRILKNGIWIPEKDDYKGVVTFKDGFDKKSKHQFDPSKGEKSRAVDIYAWVPGKKHLMWDERYLLRLSGIILGIAEDMYQRGEISKRLKNGSNWDQDGELTYTDNSENFTDLPHFEEVD